MENEAAHRARVEEQSRETIANIEAGKKARELERGIVRDTSDLKDGKQYKQIVLRPTESGEATHSLNYNAEAVPDGAFVELDAQGKPVDEVVRHFLETSPDRIELIDADL